MIVQDMVVDDIQMIEVDHSIYVMHIGSFLIRSVQKFFW